MDIVKGQRWMSEPEPELGLGVVRGVMAGKVKVAFPAAETERNYAWPGAPLVRVVFGEGERIRWAGGGEGLVKSVRAEAGLLRYQAGGAEIGEEELCGELSRRGPLDRLAAGKLDETADFELRREALFRRARWQRSPVRGLAGARMELIPHQLGIAAEVSGRLRPRVLLADEVGLGKTIEACLILHRLNLTGRADRVLILVPEPLVHQWFVELLRRFNLRFSLFDEARCESIEQGPEGAEANPFLDSQLVLCPLSLLSGDARRGRQAVAAGWDLLIVDEAHHLSEKNEAGLLAVERLAEAVPGVLLLSGTPLQAGDRGHFQRLRLLDRERYGSYAKFCEEAAGFAGLAEEVSRLAAEGAADHADKMASLLDRDGIGRVMFRNVRAALGGFPDRQVREAVLSDAAAETRVKWLAGLVRGLGEEKILLICRTRELAEAAKEALLTEIEVKAGVFHEGLNLLQRDRQAAWFSEEDGARILFCSEIGSEGRNFQFARHLVLYDLPEDPDLLEQRVGRLDRIGQRGTIQVHVPYVRGTPEEVLLRWFIDGLGALTAPVSGVSRMAEETAALRDEVMNSPTPEGIARLVAATREVRRRVAAELSGGYDRLLQWQTQGTGRGAVMADKITETDEDAALEKFQLKLLEALGMNMEPLSAHRWALQAGSPETESLPEMPVEGLTVTFDRRDALEREEISFFTADHPLLRGAMDLLLGGDQGSAACSVVAGGGVPDLLLEVCYVLECLAPADLQADRFLPALPLRVVVDHLGQDRSGDAGVTRAKSRDADPNTAQTARSAVVQLDLAGQAESLAAPWRETAVAAALKKMNRVLESEIARQAELALRQRITDAAETRALRGQQARLEEKFRSARLRVDAVRILIFR